MTTKNKQQPELPTPRDAIKMDIEYFQAPNILFDSLITKNKNELLVLLYLVRCANQGAKAFPSYQTIAFKCHLSRRTVIDTVKCLIASKLLTKEATPFKTNTYIISLPSATTAPPSATTAPYKELSIKNSLTTTRDNGHKNLFKLYEENIGILTPLISEELKDIAGEYPPEWFEEAVKEACEANTRKLSYIRAILKRWRVEGFKSPKPQRGTRGSRKDNRRFVHYEPDNPSRYQDVTGKKHDRMAGTKTEG